MDEAEGIALARTGIYVLSMLGALIAWAYLCANGTIHLNVVIAVLVGIVWLGFFGLAFFSWVAFTLIGLAALVVWAIVCGNGTVHLGGFWEIALGIVWFFYIGIGSVTGRTINDS